MPPTYDGYPFASSRQDERMPVVVRPEVPSDFSAVRRVHALAFGPHGIEDYTDDLRKTLLPGVGASLVALLDDEVVGHVLLSPALLDTLERHVTVQVLSPLGVLPEHQGVGLGSTLVRAALAAADAQGAPAVFLEGSPRYYPRFGFAPGNTQGFRRPSLRIPQSAFQAIRLSAHESWMTGTLVYSQLVWDHDAVGLRGEDLAHVLALEAVAAVDRG